MSEAMAQVIQDVDQQEEQEKIDYDFKLLCDLRLLIAYQKLGTKYAYSLQHIMQIANITYTEVNAKRISAQLQRMTKLDLFSHGTGGYTAQSNSISRWAEKTFESTTNEKLRKTIIALQEKQTSNQNP